MVMNDPPATPPWAHGPYSIKRHGVSITNCDDEPVQTPGCIQDHGALLVLRAHDLSIAQASENVAAWLGKGPAELLEQPVSAGIGDAGADRLRGFLARETVDRNPLHAFRLQAEAGRARTLDVTVHQIDDSVIVELETASQADPELNYYALVKKTVARLQRAESLARFCTIAAEEFRSLTGLDRVMIYKFHRDGHGEVYAESRRETLAPWFGMHYPAEDIPQPARDIFLQIWVRPVPDVRAPLHELVPLAHPDHGQPLNMTHCALRGASIMYTEYLQNMRVAAALTMPIRRDGELWGLIACHHYSGPAHLPYGVRAACEFLAQVVSLQHKSAEEREHLEYRLSLEAVHAELIAAAAQDGGFATLVDGSPNLLDGMDAGGAALYHRDRWWRVGATPSDAELDMLAAWLATRAEFNNPARPAYITDALIDDYPAGAAFTAVASGVLALPVSRRGNNMIMWFRPETIQTVNWGGNPDDKPRVAGPHGERLTPRRSFELFVMSVRNRALPWREVEIEAAARLRLLIMELVVGRAERLAELNADLARSNDDLDAFAYVASHDLKEPLRGIQKHAEHLLENAVQLDPEQRTRLAGLVRLTQRMNGLLDSLLHFSRVGRTALDVEQVDMNELLAEAIEMVGSRSEETAVSFVIPKPLPTVYCDAVRSREIFVNLLSNALKYNIAPHKRIEVSHHESSSTLLPGPLPAAAAGHTIFYVRDNGIGIPEKHQAQIFAMFKRLHGRDEYGGGSGAGLTIVKRLVERHGGTIWLDSKPGEGTTFYFTLPCEDPPE